MRTGVKYRLIFWSIVLVVFAVAYVSVNKQHQAAMERAKIARTALDEALADLPVQICNVRTGIMTNAQVCLLGAVDSEKELKFVRAELERRLGSDAVSRMVWVVRVEPSTSATTRTVLK